MKKRWITIWMLLIVVAFSPQFKKTQDEDTHEYNEHNWLPQTEWVYAPYSGNTSQIISEYK